MKTTKAKRSKPTLKGHLARQRGLIKKLKRGDTVVVNILTDKDAIKYAQSKGLYVRVDRKTIWGNPFRMRKEADRDLVIDKYEQYITNTPTYALLPGLKGKALGCWCAPKRCHCDVLKKWADVQD